MYVDKIMIYKFHIAVLTFLLGFFLTPMQTMACGDKSTKTEKSCCKSSKKDKSKQKNCCSKHNSKSQKEDKGCDGKCGDSSCHCTNFCPHFAVPFYATFKFKSFPIISKQRLFSRDDNYFSSGFYSIWLPPKIS